MRSNRRLISALPVLLGAGIIGAAGAAEPAAQGERSRTVIAGDEDGRTYHIVVEDGDVSAVLDGRPLMVTMHATGESRRLVPRPQTARVPAAPIAGARFIAETTKDKGDRGASVRDAGPSVQIVANVTDGRRTTVRIENGRVVSAEVGGQAWPAERVRLEGGSVLLLDEGGKVAQRIDAGLAPRPQTARVVGAFNAPAPPAPPVLAATPEPPPVMLGITMSEPDEILRVHLRLPEKGGIVVDRVIEGLPAARAGLRQHDVIVALNGQEGVTIEGMRAAMREREPGDTLRLRVISRGEPREIELRLEAYEAEKLRIPDVQAEVDIDLRVPGGGSWIFGGTPTRTTPDLEQLKAQLQETLRGIEEAIPEEEIKQKLQHAIARLERDVMQTIRIRRGDTGAGIMPDPEWIRRQVQERVQSAVPDRDDVRIRIEALETRLQRLEERISRRLDRLHERLDADENPR